jgi:hypothetical protein
VPAGEQSICGGEPAPGDRRCAGMGPAPYFALMKQGYLLASEYLNELPRQRRSRYQKRRLVFAIKQFVDACRPTSSRRIPRC